MASDRELELEAKLNRLEESYIQLQQSFANLEKAVRQRDPLKKEVLKRFQKKRKEVVKGKIAELLTGRSMELAELKDLIVDGLAYCSKASFYRYIDEMKAKGLLDMLEMEGKLTVALQAKVMV